MINDLKKGHCPPLHRLLLWHLVVGILYLRQMKLARSEWPLVTFFRSEYLTQEEALRHPDGVTMICYLIKYGVNPDARLSWVIEGFQRIQEAQKFTRIGPLPMSRLLPMFYEDYFLYWGGLETVKGDSYVTKWLVPRATLFASFEQMSEFRKLWDPWDEPNLRNFRPLQERQNRHIFFINAHWNQYNSLLPIPRVPEPSISILSPAYRKNSWMLPIQNRNNENVESENTKVSATHFVPTKI